jgi:hypothetical protein
VLGKLSPDRLLRANEYDLTAQLTRRQDCSAHWLLRRMIPAGRI